MLVRYLTYKIFIFVARIHNLRLEPEMALYARLKSICVVEKCLRFNLLSRTSFHSLSRPPGHAPAPNTRSFFLKLFAKRGQLDLKRADDIPDSFELIYRNTMSKYIVGAQVVSMVCGGLVLLTFVFKGDFETMQEHRAKWSGDARRSDDDVFYYVAFFMAILLVVQLMVSQTPVRIYKVPRTSKYIAINYGNFFGKGRLTFKRGEIYQMEERGVLPWRNSRYIIDSQNNRRTVILMENHFRRPADLNIMLGEQSDPDLDDK
jgi:hypothetical protein